MQDVRMTKRLVRYQQAGRFHFLTFRRYRRFRNLGAAPARSLFERSVEVLRRRDDFIVCG
jgi:hypothetical protein